MKKLLTLFILMLVGFVHADAAMWLVGDAFNGWEPSESVQMTQDGTTYTYEATLTAGKFFAFFKDSQAWDSQRGPQTNDAAPSGDWESTQSGGAWKVATTGEYTIEYNYSTDQAKIALKTVTPFDDTTRKFAVTGAAFGGWNMPPSSAQTFTNNGDGTYTLVYEGATAGLFKLSGVGESDTFDTSWSVFNGGCYGKSGLVEGDNTLTTSFGTGNMTFPVSGNVTLTISNVTETSCKLNIAVNTVVIPDKAWYIAGDFTDWATNKQALTENADGSFSITVNGLTTGNTFKFVDEYDNWYGGESTDETYGVHPDWCTDIDLSDTGKNFEITNGSGDLTFTISDAGKLSITGWSTTPVDPVVYLRGGFDDWGTGEQMTKGTGNVYTLTKTFDNETEFKFSEGSTWYGTTESAVQTITEATKDNIATSTDGGAQNFKLPAGEWTFTFDLDNATFSVAGTWPAVDPVIAIVGEFNSWDATTDLLTKDATEKYTITKTFDAAQTFQFVVDGEYLGGNVDNGSEAITESNSTDIAYQAGSYNNFSIVAGTWTFTLDPSTQTFSVTGEWPAVDEALNLKGDFNEWGDLTMTKNADGKWYVEQTFTAESEFKFQDHNGTWYGQADATFEFDETHLTAELATPGENLTLPAGDWTFTVDLTAMTVTIGGSPAEVIVNAPEHLYILGNVQGWDPTSGAAEMTRSEISEGKYKYEFTGTFPDAGDGKTYFSFTSALASTSGDTGWDEIAGSRYGANSDNEAITADNTDPYESKAGSYSFAIAPGTYRIELSWKEEGPDIAMWVHTEEAPKPELYLMSDLSKEGDEWTTSDTYKFTWDDGIGMYSLEDVAVPSETNFKIYDKTNNVWYGGTAEEGSYYWITDEANQEIEMNSTNAGRDFYFNVAGTWTFVVDLDQAKLSVNGTWPEHTTAYYLAGSFTDPTWADGKIAFTEGTGDYAGKLVVADQALAADAEFKVIGVETNPSTTGETATWYGAESADDPFVLTEANSASALTMTSTDGKNFQISAASTWTFVLDTENTTILLVGEWPTTPSTTPEHLYFMGDQFNGWDPQAIANGKAVELTKDGDVFTYSGRVEAGYFCLITADGEGADSDAQWANLNANYRYGSNDASNQEDIAMETTYTMAKGACTYHLTIGGTYTFTVDFSGTDPTFTYTGTEDAPANDLYLKGDFTDPTWADGGVQMTDNGDGTFTLADYTFANDALFQVVDVSTNTWYGHNGTAAIDASNHENVTIATGYENNFSIAAGTYTFVVDFNNKTMTVSGDFSTPDTGKTLQLRGSFNEWGNTDAFTDNGDGTYSITLNMSKGDEFKVVDATDGDVWYGYNTGDESLFWINGSAHTDIQLTTSDGSNNFYVGVGGTWTLTVDYATKKLNGSRVIENYGVLGDEAIFGSNWADDVVMTQADTNPNVYEATLTAVDIAAGNYDYKVRADQDWGWYDLPMTGNETLNVPADGLYDITFSLNIESHTLEATLTPITSISVTISEAEYATIYYENIAFQIPADVTASTYKVQDGHMVVSKNVTMNPAGQALVLYKAGGGTVELNIINSADAEAADADNLLVGTIWDENGIVESGYTFFYLCRKDGTGKVGFYYFNADGSSVDNIGHKAYLRVPNASVPAGVMGFSLDDALTGITGINADEIQNNGAIYTLSGVRVQGDKLPKGIYVQNGRKFVVK